MRIGIDARLWAQSGVGRYIRNLVKNLQNIDSSNDYILFVISKDYENVKCQMSNVKWSIVCADIRWHTIEEQLKFPSVLNQENLDLVHFPYFSVPIFYQKPFVVTIHDLTLHHFPTGEATTLPLPLYYLKRLGYKFIISQAAKKAKKVITVSNSTKEEIVDHLGVNQKKVVVTYEGIEDSLLSRPKDDRPLAEKLQFKNEKYLLYVGNAYPHKNLERLLSAFHSVILSQSEGSRDSSATPQNDMKLVFVGKEDYFYARLKEKVKRMELQKSVIFFGEATDKELVYLYKNAKAAVSPSLMEGFGLPIVEAMANGCLVIASNIPAHREIAGNAAIYFDPNDINSIEQKIKEVCLNDSNHFNKLIETGLKRAKIFSWKKMAAQTLTVYESCLGV